MKRKITIEGKRPADATPEKAIELHKTMTLEQIAQKWGITRQRVAQIIKSVKK